MTVGRGRRLSHKWELRIESYRYQARETVAGKVSAIVQFYTVLAGGDGGCKFWPQLKAERRRSSPGAISSLRRSDNYYVHFGNAKRRFVIPASRNHGTPRRDPIQMQDWGLYILRVCIVRTAHMIHHAFLMTPNPESNNLSVSVCVSFWSTMI